VLITHIVGARPNFMKAAQVLSAIKARGWPQMLIHTGQHYDERLSDVLFTQLELPKPDLNLGIGSGSHAQQTAAAMTGLEAAFIDRRPNFAVVYGDVNSTMAATIAAAKLQIPIAHVEAGVRSFDRRMPEEINRVVTDALADLLLSPSSYGTANLIVEGRPREAIREVGNVMVDALKRFLPKADAASALEEAGLRPGDDYALLTLHRVATVDDEAVFDRMLTALIQISARIPIVFPVHPRTRAKLQNKNVGENIRLIAPAGYLEFIGLQRDATMVITDSGGVQVESVYLGVPCLTLREATEWQETIASGGNVLLGHDPDRLIAAVYEVIDGKRKPSAPPAHWDGHAAERIADALAERL
jgi:UDP-N-acetylglucosamine 2-epimerase (non-hydrolysing)